MIIFLSRTKIVLFILVFLSFLTTNPITASASSLVLNEILVHPSLNSNPDWVEIFNPTTNQIDLNNWVIADSTSNIKNLTGNIPSNGFMVFEVSNRLNNSGDNIYLKNPDGVIIDSYSYNNDPGVDKSFARIPDGGNWITSSSLSKNNSNPSVIESPTLDQILSPSPTPINSPTPTKQQAIFTISSLPLKIDSSQSFSINIQITGLQENKQYYLKGAFLKDGSANYFGKTKVSQNWIKNNQTYSSQFPINTNSSGNWNGNLEILVDEGDSGYLGSGDYIFKVGYYNDSGLGPVWSNENTIYINNIKPTSSLNPTPSPKISPKISTPSTQPNTSNSPKPSNSSEAKIPESLLAQTASVAGVSVTATLPVNIKSQQQPNLLILSGVSFFILGLGLLGYFFKKRQI